MYELWELSEKENTFWLVIVNSEFNSPALKLSEVTGLQNSKTNLIHEPKTITDIASCISLVNAFPEIKDKLHLMGSVSPVWADIVKNWNTFTYHHAKGNIGKIEELLSTIRKSKKVTHA